MKFGKIILFILTLAFAVSCGKDNKSGTNNNSLSNPYCATTACSYSQLSGLNTSYNGVSIQSVVQQNVCITGSASRLQYSTQVALPYVVQTGDVYVGVTSYGDVGVIVGNGSNTATFTAYLCARSNYQSVVQPVSAPTNIKLGVATTCRFKSMVAATLVLSDGSGALFRMLDFGSSSGQKFQVCY